MEPCAVVISPVSHIASCRTSLRVTIPSDSTNIMILFLAVSLGLFGLPRLNSQAQSCFYVPGLRSQHIQPLFDWDAMIPEE
ncbi:MAG: hypothetical protein [Cressdnaviricota sp.]|nr:MAG: hypothetical protein [Cressdnaviricota sp.]